MAERDMGERLAALAEELRALRERVTADESANRDQFERLHHALEGPPRAESIRGRLHTLEQSEYAASVAQAALREARAARRQTFTGVEKAIGLVLAVITTSASVVAALGATGVL